MPCSGYSATDGDDIYQAWLAQGLDWIWTSSCNALRGPRMALVVLALCPWPAPSLRGLPLLTCSLATHQQPTWMHPDRGPHTSGPDAQVPRKKL